VRTPKQGVRNPSVDPADTYLKLDIGQQSIVGRRKNNQDSVLFQELMGGRGALLAVADGMGGSMGGETASRIAVERIQAIVDSVNLKTRVEDLRPLFEDAFHAVGTEIRLIAEGQPELRDMGTTLTAAIVFNGEYMVAHVGDSRAYLLRPGHLIQLTNDHTLVSDRKRAGEFVSPQEEAQQGHILTRCLSVEPFAGVEFYPPIGSATLASDESLMLCSDGLHGVLGAEQIARAIQAAAPAAQTAATLVKGAFDGGSSDNISVIVARAGVRPQKVRSRKWLLILIPIAAICLFIAFVFSRTAPPTPTPKTPEKHPAEVSHQEEPDQQDDGDADSPRRAPIHLNTPRIRSGNHLPPLPSSQRIRSSNAKSRGAYGTPRTSSSDTALVPARENTEDDKPVHKVVSSRPSRKTKATAKHGHRQSRSSAPHLSNRGHTKAGNKKKRGPGGIPPPNKKSTQPKSGNARG